MIQRRPTPLDDVPDDTIGDAVNLLRRVRRAPPSAPVTVEPFTYDGAAATALENAGHVTLEYEFGGLSMNVIARRPGHGGGHV